MAKRLAPHEIAFLAELSGIFSRLEGIVAHLIAHGPAPRAEFPPDDEAVTSAAAEDYAHETRHGHPDPDFAGPAETVDHPPHYGGNTPYEAIKVIEAWQLDFHLGNCVKYICRAGKKHDAIEDLLKARWYLDREIVRRHDREETG